MTSSRAVRRMTADRRPAVRSSRRTSNPERPGEHDVEDDQVGLVIERRRQGRVAVGGVPDLVALPHEVGPHDLADVGFVVHDEDRAHGVHHRRAGGLRPPALRSGDQLDGAALARGHVPFPAPAPRIMPPRPAPIMPRACAHSAHHPVRAGTHGRTPHAAERGLVDHRLGLCSHVGPERLRLVRGDGARREAGVDARGPLGDEGVDQLLRVDLLALGDLRQRQPLAAQLHDLRIGQAEDGGEGAGRLDGGRGGGRCGRRRGGDRHGGARSRRCGGDRTCGEKEDEARAGDRDGDSSS